MKPVKATVFSPGGEADNPELAAMAIDGNPATAWPTDTYSDPVPFPSFKNGVGLMLQLPQPTTVGSVTINAQQHRHRRFRSGPRQRPRPRRWTTPPR